MAETINFKEDIFEEEDVDMAEVAEDIKDQIEKAESKKGLKAKWNGLKTWQKVVIGATGVATVALGAKVIFTIATKKPAVVAEAATTAIAEVPVTEIAEPVVETAAEVVSEI